MKYTEIADTLEAVAAYVDDIEGTKQAAARAATEARVNKLASRYESSTGESIPNSLKEKLATLDVDSLDQLLKVAHNSNDSPASLGAPSDDLDSTPTPTTTKEASAQAGDRFLNWIVNS